MPPLASSLPRLVKNLRSLPALLDRALHTVISIMSSEQILLHRMRNRDLNTVGETRVKHMLVLLQSLLHRSTLTELL